MKYLFVALFLLVNCLPAYAENNNLVTEFITQKAGKEKAKKYSGIICKLSRKNKVPALVTASVIYRESDYDQYCSTGPCLGLMQVNKHLWFKPSENPYNAFDNINAGTRLLYNLKQRFGDWPQALTAYNYGENHYVTRSIGTSNYARKVLTDVYKFEKKVKKPKKRAEALFCMTQENYRNNLYSVYIDNKCIFW